MLDGFISRQSNGAAFLIAHQEPQDAEIRRAMGVSLTRARLLPILRCI